MKKLLPDIQATGNKKDRSGKRSGIRRKFSRTSISPETFSQSPLTHLPFTNVDASDDYRTLTPACRDSTLVNQRISESLLHRILFSKKEDVEFVSEH